MTASEREEYTHYHNVFVGVLKDWISRNSTKCFVFEGKPQNLLDKSFLPDCSQIIIPCRSSLSEADIAYRIHSANVTDVPSDRYIIQVDNKSLDEADLKTGLWNNGTINATIGAANWAIVSHADYTISGVAVYQINNDYFTDNRTFNTLRDAIDILNPSLKK